MYLPGAVSNLTQRMGLFKELFAAHDKMSRENDKDGLNDEQLKRLPRKRPLNITDKIKGYIDIWSSWVVYLRMSPSVQIRGK
jgi:hypothetical protein